MTEETLLAVAPPKITRRPRLGFLGVGWIGRHRMQAILGTGAVEAAAIADPSREMMERAAELAPKAERVSTLTEILNVGVDGVVIATPSAFHAEQSIQVLEHGAAVFCQKPLGRALVEVRAVIDAARKADRLLSVDLSYRFTVGMRRIREAIKAGGLGHVYAVDLVFHNAYGPDKAWFYDPALSGGGCVMDLGVHLVDLALWALGNPAVENISSKLFAGGRPLITSDAQVEDYAVSTLELATGAVVNVACSWRLQAGCDAKISAAFYGTSGGAAFQNVNGSFYDFTAERYYGTAKEVLSSPPDAWGGRAACDWAIRLAAGERFDPSIEGVADVAHVLDRIYGRISNARECC